MLVLLQAGNLHDTVNFSQSQRCMRSATLFPRTEVVARKGPGHSQSIRLVAQQHLLARRGATELPEHTSVSYTNAVNCQLDV